MSYEWTNSRFERTIRAPLAVLLVLCVWMTSATAGEVPQRHLLANGLDVTIHSCEYLRAGLSGLGDDTVITLDDGRRFGVITDIEDPSITNKGDGSFHPFDEAFVLETLSGVSHAYLRFPVTVYILPYPRRSVLVSSTSGTEIFLSPHVLEIQPAVSAYIVAHELGHVFHNKYLPDDTDAWTDYRRVRGIDDTRTYSESASHPYRPKEIFAEDFRVLFGGYEAAWDGQIENPDLVTPTLVVGLQPYLSEIGGTRVYARAKVVASSYPNPFNPETQILVNVPSEVIDAQREVSVRIYDVRGALVKEIFKGHPSSDVIRVRWDGTDRSGNSVASAQYFAQIRAGDHKTTLKLIMLK